MNNLSNKVLSKVSPPSLRYKISSPKSTDLIHLKSSLEIRKSKMNQTSAK